MSHPAAPDLKARAAALSADLATIRQSESGKSQNIELAHFALIRAQYWLALETAGPGARPAPEPGDNAL